MDMLAKPRLEVGYCEACGHLASWPSFRHTTVRHKWRELSAAGEKSGTYIQERTFCPKCNSTNISRGEARNTRLVVLTPRH